MPTGVYKRTAWHAQRTREGQLKPGSRMGLGHRGKKLSPEHGKKIGEANRRRIITMATREKISKNAIERYSHHEHVRPYKQVSRLLDTQITAEHRIVMENKMMRLLKPKEVVHHWDENKRNNAPENLALMRSDAAHLRLHQFARRHGLPVEALKFDQPWLDPIE